jgi:hypothetical protein
MIQDRLDVTAKYEIPGCAGNQIRLPASNYSALFPLLLLLFLHLTGWFIKVTSANLLF